MNEPIVIFFDRIPPIARGGGVVSRPLAGAPIGTEGFTSGITTFPPGTEIKFHTHNVEEAVTILEGDARCDIEDRGYLVKRLDTSYVPAGVPHRFVNVGDGPMSILWVYTGIHVTRTFVDSGETVEHMAGNDLAGR